MLSTLKPSPIGVLQRQTTVLPVIDSPSSNGLKVPSTTALQKHDLFSDSFPAQISPMVWTGEDRKGKGDNLFVLNEDEINSIETAVRDFKATGLELSYLSPKIFKLPESLAKRLRAVSETLHNGVGYATVRGLDSAKYNDLENTIIFNGLSSYIGRLRSTNKKGVSMSHLRDAGRDRKPENHKHTELNESKLPKSMKFHADRFYGDIIAMYVKSDDATGGEQYFASFPYIYNVLAESDPATLRVLAKDWAWPNPKENETLPKSPVIFHASNRVIVQLIYRPFVDAGFSSAAEQSALETVQSLAEKHCVQIERQAGDLQFFNNLGLLHARNKFQDSSAKGRHMLRLGLRDPELAWDLPEEHREKFDKAFEAKPRSQVIYPTDVDPWDRTTATTFTHG
ncbi:MAG: hypothetical protein M1820_003456 [Bogoriella megaspora]|nr:MAG: hypothetical protein M1820_003456 [Bogoriella megaspora]